MAAPDRLIFLHIPKTGGTAVRHALGLDDGPDPDGRLIWGSHLLTLALALDRRPDVSVAFFLRDPVDRFVSGFLSRWRKGKPRYDSGWTAGEAAAFAAFPDINTLGEALADNREDAADAAAAIRHTRPDYARILGTPEALNRAASRIAFVGRTEHLDKDFAQLRRWLGLPRRVVLPNDATTAHRMPAGLAPTLTDKARAGIRAHVQAEMPVYRQARKLGQQVRGRVKADLAARRRGRDCAVTGND